MFLCLVGLLASDAGADVYCKNLFPAVQMMPFGVDLLKVDIYRPSQGKTIPVIKYTCNENNTQTINGVVYDVPDAIVTPIEATPAGVLVFHRFVAGSSLDWQEQMSLEFDTDSFLGLFSSSASFAESERLILEGDAYSASVTSLVAGFRPSFHPAESWSKHRPVLSDDAQDFVESLLSNVTTFNATTVGAFNKFFDLFGLDWITTSCQGGIMRLEYFTEKTFVETSDWAYVSGQADLAFLGFLRDSGAFSGAVNKTDVAWQSATKLNAFYLGGQGAPSPTTYNEWAKSTLVSPHVILCGGADTLVIRSLSQLMPASLTKPFDQARANYYDREYLTDVLASLATYSATVTLIRPQGTCVSPPQCVPYPCAPWPLPSCCTTSDGVRYNATVDAVSRDLGTLNTTITHLMAIVTLTLVSPIVNHTDVVAIATQFNGVTKVLQDLPTTAVCSYDYHHTDQDAGPGDGPLCNPCSPPDYKIPMAHFTYPRNLGQ